MHPINFNEHTAGAIPDRATSHNYPTTQTLTGNSALHCDVMGCGRPAMRGLSSVLPGAMSRLPCGGRGSMANRFSGASFWVLRQHDHYCHWGLPILSVEPAVRKDHGLS